MLIDLGPARDIPPLVLPHARRCRPAYRDHPSTHCYRERDLEDRVEEYITATFPRSTVSRQERWAGVGIVDLVVRTDIPFGTVLTVIELKATPARASAHGQLIRYMEAAHEFYWDTTEPVALMGVLGAFYIPDPWLVGRRPAWFAYWQMDVAT